MTLALLFFCLAAPIAVWSIGGLEQPLYGALLAASIALIRRLDEDHAGRPGVWLSVALGLLCLTRPDGAIFCVAAAAAFAIGSRWWRLGIRESLGRGPALARGPLICVGGQLLFRAVYYHAWVPISASIKLTPSPEHWLGGWRYLVAGIESLRPFWDIAMAAIALIALRPRTRVLGLYSFLAATLWSGYVVFIGGDIFPAYRH